MEEKKIDIKSIIGYVLIFGLLLWMLYNNKPSEAELEEQAKQEQVEADKAKLAQEAISNNETLVTTPQDYNNLNAGDSLQIAAMKNKLGSFAYSETLNSAEETLVENNVLSLKLIIEEDTFLK